MVGGDISRRGLLRTVGTGAVGVGLASGGAAGRTDGDRYVVGTGADRGTVAAKYTAAGVDREIDFGATGGALVGQFSEADARALESDPDVRYVEPDYEVRAFAQSEPWGVDRVGALAAHAQGETGEGGHIAILDTGIDADHPDLRANVGEGYAVEECEGDDCASDWDDDHSHGTHCAGIADAAGNAQGVVGVSTSATLHPVKVLTAEGGGSASGVAEGITWATDQGHDTISMSLGGDEPSSVIRDAVRYAWENGVLVVAAAGNNGPCLDCVRYPAKYPEVVAVSATDDDDEVAGFSSVGEEVELAAPGSDVLSTVVDGEYERFSGTSMATPHVAGAAAILMAGGMTNEEARARLGETAEDIGLADTEQGRGLLDVARAVGVDDGDDGDAPENPENPDEPDEPEEPELAVRTGRATGICTDGATLTGELTSLGDAEGAAVGFEYWTRGEAGRKETAKADDLEAPGAFEFAIEGLSANETYAFNAAAVGSDDSQARGEMRTFSTGGNGEPPEEPGEPGEPDEPDRPDEPDEPADPSLPRVVTGAASDVDDNSAELSGRVADLGDAEEVDPGFVYWVKGARGRTEEWDDTFDMERPGSYDESIIGLEAETTYVYAATGETDDGTVVEGERREFTTLAD